MTRLGQKRFARWCAGAACAASACSLHAAPVLEYRFNESAGAFASSGSDGAAAQLAAPAAYGADGSGVTGTNGDRALDLTAASAMGSPASTPTRMACAQHTNDNASIDGLTTITFSGWFKTESAPIGDFATLLSNWETTSPNKGIYLAATNARLVMKADGGSFIDGGSFGDSRKWVFFALTYDGSATANNVKFYKGYRNDTEAGGGPGSAGVQLVATGSRNAGSLEDETQPLIIGNFTDLKKPFDGWLDNIRVHGSKSDAAGALGLDALERLRAADVVPPSALAGGCRVVVR